MTDAEIKAKLKEGGTGITLLVNFPDKVLPLLDTVEQVEAIMGGLLAYWKTLPENSPEAKQSGTVYAKLLTQRKLLLGQTPAATVAMTDGTKQALEQVKASAILKPDIKTLGTIVVENPHATFQDAIVILTGRMMAAVIDQYHGELGGDTAQWNLFIGEVAKTIDFKRKIISSGKLGQAYAAAFAKLKGQPVPVAPAPLLKPAATVTAPNLDALVKAPKKATKKTKASWVSVADALVTVPVTCPKSDYAGKLLSHVTTGVEKLMTSYVKDERQVWAAQGIECSEIVLKHNFLTGLVGDFKVLDNGDVVTVWKNSMIRPTYYIETDDVRLLLASEALAPL